MGCILVDLGFLSDIGYTPHFLPAAWEGGAEVGRSVRLRIDSASGGELRGCPV